MQNTDEMMALAVTGFVICGVRDADISNRERPLHALSHSTNLKTYRLLKRLLLAHS